MHGQSVDLFSLEELERLANEDIEQETQTAEETQTSAVETEDTAVDKTKAFAKRLKESTDKVRYEEREAIAKQLGFESYDALLKSRETDTIKNKGLDPEDVSPIIDEIVKQRIDNDPRIKELEELRQEKLKNFAKNELAEITKLTGGEITSLAQLSSEVIELWKQKGSLKSAYLEKEGEKLITKMRAEQSKGSTEHLASMQGNAKSQSGSERPLTPEERAAWKTFHPHMTDEELNKKTVKIN